MKLAASLLALGMPLSAAHAGLLGTLGNVALDGGSVWYSKGHVEASPDTRTSWNERENTSGSRFFDAPDTDPGTVRVTIDHQIRVDTAQSVKLSSSASATGQFLFGDTKGIAYGASHAIVNDIVFVSGPSIGSAYISLGWHVDGTLTSRVKTTHPGSTIDGANGVFWASLTDAEVAVSYQNPLNGGATETEFPQRFRSDPVPARKLPSLDHWWAQDCWACEPNNWASGNVMAPGKGLWESVKTVDEAGGWAVLIPVPIGIPIPISMQLFTSYNAGWDLRDMGEIEGFAGAEFAHTALLQSVQLFNADGTPYVGTWELVSANGIDYPELILPAQAAVSAPASLGLLLIGLAGLALRTPRRLTSPA